MLTLLFVGPEPKALRGINSSITSATEKGPLSAIQAPKGEFTTLAGLWTRTVSEDLKLSVLQFFTDLLQMCVAK